MTILWVGVLVTVTVLFYVYFRSVSEAIYQESSDHLSEVYEQVDHNFDDFIKMNWMNLSEWAETDRSYTDDQIIQAIKTRQELWGFTSFFYLDKEGNYYTPEGIHGHYDLGDSAQLLFTDKEFIMKNEANEDKSEVVLFAVPTEPSTYNDFSYEAVGLTYTNADMVASINTDAFGGKTTSLIIKPTGEVVLSTLEGGNIFSNYLSYLKAGSNLSEEQLTRLINDWTERKSGVIRFSMKDTSYFLSYHPCDYRDLVMIGVVSEQVASSALTNIQQQTVNTLLIAFVLVSAVGIVQIIITYRNRAKKSQRAINYRDTVFERLSANIGDIILMLDGNTWKVDYISPNIERLLGVSTAEIEQDIRALDKTLYDEDVIIPAIELADMPFDAPVIVERRHMHQKTGEMLWYRESVYHQKIDDEEKYIIVMSDRTDEKKMNMNLQEALATAKNANEAKSRFLSNMSHDIRTPMNAIMGFTVLLAKNTKDPERVEDYVRKISTSSKHLLSLINDVLDMSKIESGKTTINTTQFNFQEAVDEVYSIIEPQAKAKQQTLTFEIKGHPSEHLTGDQLRVNQILLNLLSNAVKYTQEGGNIEFIIEKKNQSTLFKEDIRFIVKDNGMGMTEEFLSTIFDPFTREENSTTNKVQGTGLGMAITKSLVDLMGGIIHIDSKLNVGTTVTVDLSFGMPEDFSDDAFWEKRNIYKMLVVDDDEDVCKNVKEMMEETGVIVDYITEAHQAVDKVMDANETEEPYSLIVLDWKMPGMNGVECAKLIRQNVHEHTPILVLTAYDWSDIEEQAIEAGIDGFLAKPFFVTSLQQELVTIGEHKQAKEPKEINENILKGKHFFAAEDNKLNADLLKDRLELEGASVEIVSNGLEAVERFKTIEEGEFDLILMDAQMPVMDGYEATCEIRKLDHPLAKTMPIIALTANIFAEDVQAALNAGMNAHLGKPLDMDELKMLVEKFATEKTDTRETTQDDKEEEPYRK